MSKSLLEEKLIVLIGYGLSESQAVKLIAGGIYFQKSGGVDLTTYWNDPSNFNIRDEFFLIANSHLAFIKLIEELDVIYLRDWLGEFQVAYLFQIKLNAQTIKSIDVLLSQNCYADAFTLCRTLQSRTNFLLLCSLAPELFDHWLRNPNDQRYREGQVRKELAALSINTMDHIYKLASEIIHGHFLGHSGIGYFEKGWFKEIPPVRHQVYTIAKFLLAASTYAFIQAMLIGSKDGANIRDTDDMDQLYEHFFKTILDPSRLDPVFSVVLGEDRHWKKIGKNEFNPGGTYSFAQLKDQIQKFHRTDGNQNRLSKRYHLGSSDGYQR